MMQKLNGKIWCTNAMQDCDRKIRCKNLMQKCDAKVWYEKWKLKSEKWKVKSEMWNESINLREKLLLGELSDWESENHGRSPELWSLFLNSFFLKQMSFHTKKRGLWEKEKMPSGRGSCGAKFFLGFFFFWKMKTLTKNNFSKNCPIWNRKIMNDLETQNLKINPCYGKIISVLVMFHEYISKPWKSSKSWKPLLTFHFSLFTFYLSLFTFHFSHFIYYILLHA